jgi:hypothetical protein
VTRIPQKHGLVRAILTTLLLASSLGPRGSAADRDKPPSVFVDAGACPFEGCKYREWTVEEETVLLDKPNGKQAIATLAKGDAVIGLTGEVISEPVAAKTDRDIPQTPIKRGDTFYVLHYDGEGYWKVWFRGKITFVHQSVIDFPKPKAEWWVKVKTSRNKVGWALSHGNFGHQDAYE